MFHTGAQIPGDHPRLEGGGDVSRVMKIGTVAEANAAEREIVRVVRAWCDWRDSTKGSGGSAKKNAASKDYGGAKTYSAPFTPTAMRPCAEMGAL
jgi:hypothetical protein